MSFYHSSLYLAALCLLNVFLSFRIIFLRRRHQVGLGSGKNQELSRAIRAHGNLVEHAPLAWLLILVLELSSHSLWLIHGFGLTLLTARLLHAYGLGQSAGTSFGRFVGMLMTFAVLVGASGVLFVQAIKLL